MKKIAVINLMAVLFLLLFGQAQAQTQILSGVRAGITQLIGCGTGSNADKAEVAVTVDGNVSDYQFSFDGGAFQAANTAWLAAGPHTIRVKKRFNSRNSAFYYNTS